MLHAFYIIICMVAMQREREKERERENMRELVMEEAACYKAPKQIGIILCLMCETGSVGQPCHTVLCAKRPM